MKVIKNPITDHLPAGCRKVATSFSAEKPIKPTELVVQDAPIAFVVGAMAHGQVFVLFKRFIVLNITIFNQCLNI